tara:strand:- start:457 stop:564 length:108 start_codon:yes stop_codon:yes gene_type:complete
MKDDEGTREAALQTNFLAHIDMARRCQPAMIEKVW